MVCLKSLFVNTIILTVVLCESSLAGCPSGQTEDKTNGHCIQSGNACYDNKCTYYYDTTTHDMVIKPNLGVNGEIKIFSNFTGSHSPTIRNMTIEEGITSLASLAVFGVGEPDGKLSLPSTLSSIDYFTSIYATGFGTIDASAVTEFSRLIIGTPAVKNVVVSENSSPVYLYSAYDIYPDNVEIKCKGELDVCQRKIIKASNSTNLSFDYYKEYDSHGNIIEAWGPKGKTTYQNKYDGAGNLVSIYENGKQIYAKKIYTPKEAAAALKDDNDNIVSISW